MNRIAHGTSPDGGVEEIPRRKRKSPSDLRREARRLVERQAEARADRRDGWPDGKDSFAAARLETKLSRLDGEKRDLRQDFYRREPKADPAFGRHVHTTRVRDDR